MKKPARRIRRYDTGGAVSDSGASTSDSSGSGSSSGLSGYYNMLSQMRGSLGGSRASPYASPQGGNSYFSKGGPVGRKAGAKTTAKRKRK